MKTYTKYILQTLLGFKRYLFVFAWFMVYKLKWDKNEKDFIFFLNMIPDRGSVLDIGANIGVMTVHLAKKLKMAKIYSFEPIPHNLRVLKRITAKFKTQNVKIFDVALGNKNGKINMVLPSVGKVKFHGLSHVIGQRIEEYDEGENFEVNIRRLDDMDEISDIKTISAIKIDVENYEYEVFKGAKQLLKKHRPLIYCELWDNENRKWCFDFLTSMNYAVRVLQNRHLVRYNPEDHTTQNFFFIYKKNRP